MCDSDSTQFLVLFGAVFGGAMIVTFNTRILGGRISYFQSVSILGYCVFPLFLIILLLKVLSLVGVNSMTAKLLGVVVAAVWGVFCTSASTQLLRPSLPSTFRRRRGSFLSIPSASSTFSLDSSCFTCDSPLISLLLRYSYAFQEKQKFKKFLLLKNRWCCLLF